MYIKNVFRLNKTFFMNNLFKGGWLIIAFSFSIKYKYVLYIVREEGYEVVQSNFKEGRDEYED